MRNELIFANWMVFKSNRGCNLNKSIIIVYCLLLVIICFGCNKQDTNGKNTNKATVQIDHEIVKLYPVAKKVGEVYMWGYVDENGTKVLDYKYGEATIFSEGRAFVEENNERKYIDKNGNELLSLNAINFKEGNSPGSGLLCCFTTLTISSRHHAKQFLTSVPPFITHLQRLIQHRLPAQQPFIRERPEGRCFLFIY